MYLGAEMYSHSVKKTDVFANRCMGSSVCAHVTQREGMGRVIKKVCKSERKCVCGDKYRSLESDSLRIKKVSVDVQTWNVM